MNIQERHQLLAEKTSLERMLADIPESSVIDRMSLEARKTKVEKALAKEITISLSGSLCVILDGQKVYERIAAAIEKGQNVTVSFRDISTLTATFLNIAIGQLYGTFSEEQIRTLLKVEDMHQDELALLKHVVERAKGYFADKKVVER